MNLFQPKRIHINFRYCTQYSNLGSGGHIFDVCSSFKACQSNVGIPLIYRVNDFLREEKLVNLFRNFISNFVLSLPKQLFYRMTFQPWKMDAIRCPSIAIKNYFFFILLSMSYKSYRRRRSIIFHCCVMLPTLFCRRPSRVIL